jgi:hypothetical protein
MWLTAFFRFIALQAALRPRLCCMASATQKMHRLNQISCRRFKHFTVNFRVSHFNLESEIYFSAIKTDNSSALVTTTKLGGHKANRKPGGLQQEQNHSPTLR